MDPDTYLKIFIKYGYDAARFNILYLLKKITS